MIKDITLGQFLPGNSVVHRLDPRTKIILTTLYVTVLFMLNNYTGYLILALFTVFIIGVSEVPFGFVFRGVKPLFLFLLFTMAVNLFMSGGEVIFKLWFLTATWEGLHLAIQMSLRLVFLLMGTSLLTFTTSPITLTDGIESLLHPLKRVGVPAHELAMMMTIAIRFIPTIIEETDKIMKAQAARGADFESGSLWQRAKAMVPLLVPLFISAFRRADELAMAMECRCYNGGDGRTKLKQLKMGRVDLLGFLFMVAFGVVLVLVRNVGV